MRTTNDVDNTTHDVYRLCVQGEIVRAGMNSHRFTDQPGIARKRNPQLTSAQVFCGFSHYADPAQGKVMLDNLEAAEVTPSNPLEFFLNAIVDELRGIRQAIEKPDPAKTPTQEEIAMLVVLRMKNPTQRAVAKAVGLKHHASLKKWPAVLELITRVKMLKEFSPGNGRSIVRRNGEPLHSLIDDWE